MLKRIKVNAKREGKKVTVRKGNYKDSLGAGKDVYIDGKKSEVWFMELTDHCVC